MASIDSNIKKPSPFLQGVAKCFDIAGFLDDFTLPALQDGNPILNDWQAVGSDYNNSIKIINEELYAEKKSKGYNPFNYPQNNFVAVALLPPPEILQKYNSVVPGLADRIVTQAEKQTTHRIALGKKMLTSNFWKSFAIPIKVPYSVCLNAGNLKPHLAIPLFPKSKSSSPPNSNSFSN
jgi:hypothetical protein